MQQQTKTLLQIRWWRKRLSTRLSYIWYKNYCSHSRLIFRYFRHFPIKLVHENGDSKDLAR